MNEIELIGKEINNLFLIFGRDISKEMLKAWTRELIERGYNYELIKTACNLVSTDPDIEPYNLTIATLISKVQKTDDQAAIEAYNDVACQLSRGKYDTKSFDDKTYFAVKSIGGMERLGQCGYDEVPFLKRDFIDAYKSCSKEYKRQDAIGQSNNPKVIKLMDHIKKSLNND